MFDKKDSVFAHNTFAAKIKRSITAILPISKLRKGACSHCGECCKLPNICPFLYTDNKGLQKCKVYPIRPLNCRKYPRVSSEWITRDTCGYRFD